MARWTARPRATCDPGSSGDPVVLERGAQVIDLMPYHDPVIRILVRRVRHGVPVRDRYLLDPLNPHCIVHVPELIDVLWPSGQHELEDGMAQAVSVSMKA